MGVSTDAIHFFGWCSDSEDPIYWPWDYEYDEAADEWVESEEYISQEDWLYRAIVGEPISHTNFDDYSEYKRVRDSAIIDYLGVAIHVDYHCSDDYPMDLVAIHDTHSVASRGCPCEGVVSQEPPAEWYDAITRFGELTGHPEIADRSQIGWWPCSYWG